MATLRGTNGNDSISGDINDVPEADTISGLAGDDRLFGLFGNDVLFGGAGDDSRLDGGGGDDRLFGGAGNDVLLGATGNDSLSGAAGDDFIRGEQGRDFLAGGDGADIFFFGESAFDDPPVYESGVGRGNRDRIIDFDAAEGDEIDVSAIDADLTVISDQAFTFVGEVDAGGLDTGELGYFESNGGTIVRGVTGDDPAAAFEIQLDGVGLGLDAGDFFL